MKKVILFFTVMVLFSYKIQGLHRYWNDNTVNGKKYGEFSDEERVEMLEGTKRMFHFGYDNYIKYAFPDDELNPIYCTGRGHDHADPSNININDALGDYILTLVDSLDTLAIMGNSSEFKRAVSLVVENLSFEKANTIQVFEATIRVLGSLLSAHLIITDPNQPFGDMVPPQYDNELLSLANDLATRLLPAFENTATGIPFPRVNLKHGVPVNSVNTTCTAGAGTLVLEFGVLSRLLGDPTYEAFARRAVKRLWSFRSNVTGMLGHVINVQTGEWVGEMSGLGAGLDSFFEYLLKTFIMFGEDEDLKMFNESYETIKFHMRRGRQRCNYGNGYPPIYVNVNMKTGITFNNWIDSLQAAWAGVQVLKGDIEEAICSHALFYSIWQKYGFLPERYNWHLKAPDVLFYPLRPELVESTYLLYQATKNPFYLHVGRDIFNSIDEHAKAKCGYGTVHDVNTKSLEDRMESFFLSETCKYLYLLFDKDNHVNREQSKYLFSTEGHLFPVDRKLRLKPWQKDEFDTYAKKKKWKVASVVNARHNATYSNCDNIPTERRYFIPLGRPYFEQIQDSVGLY